MTTTDDRVELDTSGLQAALRHLEGRLPTISGSAALDAAQAAADRTRAALPHRTGRLAGSVRAARDGADARLSIGAPYAGWVIYGGSRGRAYVAEGRYLGPALSGADRDMAQRAERELDAEARRL